MKNILLVILALPTIAFAATPAPELSLEDQMKTLDINNRAPESVTKEKLYSVQNRYLELKNKNELTLGVAQNLTGDSFLLTQVFNVAYRFHINDRFSVGLAHGFFQNQFSNSGKHLLVSEGVTPDVAYARNTTDLTVEYNILYGKFRLSMDQVLYFDFYGALGAGRAELNSGMQNAAVADTGFVFWLGKWGSARLGVKDYFYKEPKVLSATTTHNLHGHLDIGYIF